MPRVSKESLEKLHAFIDSLPVEARNKCALCNETLVHLVKTAEVESGVGTATVTRALADRINEDAAPGDRVTPTALDRRVRRQEESILPKRENKPQPQYDQPAEKRDEKPVSANKPQAPLKNWREKRGAPQPEPTLIMSSGFNDAYDAFIKHVANAKRENWEHTSKAAIFKCIETIMIYLED